MGRGCQKGDGAVAAALAHAPPPVKGRGPGGGGVAKGKDAEGKDAKGKDDDGKGDDGKGDDGKGKYAAVRASSFALDGYASTSSESSDSLNWCICRCGEMTVAADPQEHAQNQRGWRMLQCACLSCGPGGGRCTVRCWGRGPGDCGSVCSDCCM